MKLSNENYSMIITKDGEVKEMPYSIVEIIKEEIKEFRLEQARTIQLPAYCIFPNITLNRLALLMPRTKNELWLVDGMGELLIDTYGDEICDIVNKVLNRFDIVEILYGFDVFNVKSRKVKAILGFLGYLEKFPEK